jgi:hypothetical protein
VGCTANAATKLIFASKILAFLSFRCATPRLIAYNGRWVRA